MVKTTEKVPMAGTVEFVSSRVKNILGYEPDEFFADPRLWFRLLHPDDVPALWESTRNIIATRKAGTRVYRVRHKETGEYRWMEDRVVPQLDDVGHVIGIFGVARDITERKRAEEALRESEERFSKAFRANPAAIVISLLADGRIIDCNDSFLKIFVCTRDEVLGRTSIELGMWNNSHDRKRLVDRLQRQGSIHNEEVKIRTKSGMLHDAIVSAERIELGGQICLLTMIHDITECKQAEEALRESEARFRTLAETAPAAITIYQGSKLRYVNRAGEAITGYKREELLKMDFLEVVHPDFRELAKERLLARQRGEEVPSGYEIKIVTKTGQERWLYATAGLIQFDGEVAAIGTCYDITERRQAEEALETFSRRLLEAHETERRRIARELHDEIGQVLTAVQINLQALQSAGDACPVAPRLDDSLDIVEQALREVQNLSLDLRPSLLDDLGLVAALRWFVDRQAERSGLIARFDADPSIGRLNPELETACFRIVQEALTNVIRHAQAKHVLVELRRHEAGLLLTIRDDGVGFDASAVQKNTLPDVRLGLKGMEERALALGGRIEIESAPGRGTEVRARFPLKKT